MRVTFLYAHPVISPSLSFSSLSHCAARQMPNNNGGTSSSTLTRSVRSCNCCPYGYHIDLDFVRYCEALANAKPSEEELQRRDRRRSRKSMEFMLGFESLFGNDWQAESRVQPKLTEVSLLGGAQAAPLIFWQLRSRLTCHLFALHRRHMKVNRIRLALAQKSGKRRAIGHARRRCHASATATTTTITAGMRLVVSRPTAQPPPPAPRCVVASRAMRVSISHTNTTTAATIMDNMWRLHVPQTVRRRRGPFFTRHWTRCAVILNAHWNAPPRSDARRARIATMALPMAPPPPWIATTIA